jgi:DNA-binding NarL/FixJ family response regulator
MFPAITTTRVYLVDEHPVIAAGLRELINLQPGWTVVGSAASCDHALRDLERDPVDLVVLEPGIDGMDGLGRLGVFAARARVLCFSSLGEQPMAERALREGARGFLMKTSMADEILEAMYVVLEGGIALSPEMRQRLVGRLAGVNERDPESVLGRLSNRELQIIHLIGFNRSSRQIARHIRVSEKTVATHRLRIREKLCLRNTNELIRVAAQWVGRDSLS